MVLFVAWQLALLAGLVRRAWSEPPGDLRDGAAGFAAALAAILLIAVQTDAIGIPWLAYCLWWLCGSLTAASFRSTSSVSPSSPLTRTVSPTSAPASHRAFRILPRIAAPPRAAPLDHPRVDADQRLGADDCSPTLRPPDRPEGLEQLPRGGAGDRDQAPRRGKPKIASRIASRTVKAAEVSATCAIPNRTLAKSIQQVEQVTIRFAGDSGDGMQLPGAGFTSETAVVGNDLSTLPDFPAEIRAPAGSPAGRLGLPDPFRRPRHPHAGRPAGRARGDEPGRAQDEPERPARRTAR